MSATLLKSARESANNLHGERPKTVSKSTDWQVQSRSRVWSPPTDVIETEDNYVVRVEIAGLRDQDFAVTLDHNYLVIAGSRPDIPERRAYHQMEIRFGEFNTVVAIPGAVDVERTAAEYSDGFLVVTLPKKKTK
jgi:HSP20 family protein